MKVYIETYGCTLNRAESDIMAALLMGGGHTIVNSPDEADVIILNTCTVKLSTENKILHRISTIKKPLVVAGCMWVLEKKIRSVNKNVVILNPGNISSVVEAVEYAKRGLPVSLISFSSKSFLPRIYTKPILRVAIQEGCVGNCTFCQTKLARPKLQSFDKEWIIKQVEEGVKRGAVEIEITGMDTGAYGMERGENLTELLRDVLSLPGRFFVRLGMINPYHAKRMLKDLLTVYNHEKMFKFLHIPVQTGSEKVCREMKRNHTVKDFVDVVKAFRERFPEITVSTDIIVGYPTETEEDFEKTKELLLKVRPDIVNLSRFTPREGTEAAKLKPLPSSVVKERTKEMARLIRHIAWDNNQRFVNTTMEVIITEKGKGGWKGRSLNYKQVFLPFSEGGLGERVEGRIYKATHTTLFATDIRKLP